MSHLKTTEVFQSQPSTLILYFVDSTTGDGAEGLSFSNFSPLWFKAQGQPSASLALTALSFREVDALNLPGAYEVDLPSTVFSNLGECLFRFPSNVISEELIVTVTVIRELTQVDLSSVTSELTSIQGVGFTSGTDSLTSVRSLLDSDLTSIQVTLSRILGLSQENFTLTGHVYDAQGSLTQSTITLYPSRDDLILEQNVLASYTMLSSYDVSGRLLTYSVRKNA